MKNSDDVLKRLKQFKRVLDSHFTTTYDSEAMNPSARTEEGSSFLMLALDDCNCKKSLCV